MKKVSTIKYITESTEKFAGYKKEIETAESYEKAKGIAYKALGYIDSMITFLNCMTCEENNDFTEELDEVLSDWEADVYEKLAIIADREGETEKALILWKMRDEARA